MNLFERHATGLEYLHLVTDLLQRIRSGFRPADTART
jgi:hypothetical protein